jgi:uridine kinase
MKPYIIGVAGGSASGKTTLCEEIFKNIGGLEEATLVPLDSFYKELT